MRAVTARSSWASTRAGLLTRVLRGGGHGLFDLAQFPKDTLFEPLSEIDRCVLFSAYNFDVTPISEREWRLRQHVEAGWKWGRKLYTEKEGTFLPVDWPELPPSRPDDQMFGHDLE